MNSEKIKLLRSKIPVPLNTAVYLLKKYNEDILKCEQEFHRNNIYEICRATDCDEEIARVTYSICRYNLERAIRKINSKPLIITTREEPLPKNEIGFILYTEDENEDIGQNLKTVFIPASDFNYIIDAFKSVFPAENPRNNIIEEEFDICGSNYFDQKKVVQIVENIAEIKIEGPKHEKFLEEVIHWLKESLNSAAYIVVYGNL